MDLRNKKVTVVGFGNSGIGCALLLYSEGAIVSVTDNADTENIRKNEALLKEKYIATEIGAHTEAFLADTELFVASPGVGASSLPLRYAKENNIPVISEMELGYSFCKAPIVAVTGTNGKSTVVSLIGSILGSAGIPVRVCGNIGNSLSGEISAPGQRRIGKDAVVVLEASSFQLERISSFRPKISVILNVTEDHLDRHGDFWNYFAAKKNIFKNQKEGDITVLNYDDGNVRNLAESGRVTSKVLYFSAKKKVEGAYLDKGVVKIFLKRKAKGLFDLKETNLKGAHNTENILASVLVATLLGADTHSIKKALKDFVPLAHRFEIIAKVGGVEFIDDSKATNVDSACRALKAAGRRTILIAGGKDKNLPYEKVIPALKKGVKKVILIGETRHKMRGIFEKYVAVEEKDSLEEAVRSAYRSASPGGCVLLSPMCSSFDMFRDFEHRGEVFREAVKKLKHA
ncbi:MAG: UDP-N-acetylmuramoyl-L-alanine--D-glutamate ligase [Candidatus Omnitrophota bacterium]